MDPLKAYVIPFKGMKNGIHEIEYQLDKEFFDCFEYSIIKQGQFDVKLTMDKRINMMILNFEIDGLFKGDCDRCLNEIDIEAASSNEIHIKIGDRTPEDQGVDVIYIGTDAAEIDVSEYLYEFTHMGMPMSKLKDCEEDDYKDCNQKVLDKLFGSEEEEEQEQEEPKENPFGKAFKGLDLN